MTKAKQLSKKQLAVIDDLFPGDLGEQAVLDKHRVSRNRYNRWTADEVFAEEFGQRIAGAYRQSTFISARHVPSAAVKLVRLTKAEKEETARKTCLDIIFKPALVNKNPPQPAQPQTTDCPPTHQLSKQTASRLLAGLAEGGGP